MTNQLRPYHGREKVNQPSGFGGGGGGGSGGGSGGGKATERAPTSQKVGNAVKDMLSKVGLAKKPEPEPEPPPEMNYAEMPEVRGPKPDPNFMSSYSWSPREKKKYMSADSFAMDKATNGQEAMDKARSVCQTVGSKPSGQKNVPITPVGVATRKAIRIAQAMIERLSTVEDDESVQADEFLYDTRLLMKLDINPMRGLRSAKVGRSKAPVAIFLDYSGSCDHVADLFGTIMVGFANEGATILIGGNGSVQSVYHPFPNRPLEDYAADAQTVVAQRHYNAETRVRAGYLVSCGSTSLRDFKLKALIACTDSDSYSDLMARPAFDTHVVYAVDSGDYPTYRNFMKDGKYQAEGKEFGYGSYLYNLSYHQHVHLVCNLETLTEMLQTGR